MLSVHNLSKSFGVHQVIHNLSLELSETDKVLISGPNGCGKSTLAKILVGVLSQTAGQVHCKQSIGWMPAQSESFFPELTGRENLHTFAKFNHVGIREVEQSIEQHSSLLNDEILESRFKSFSSGMRQKLNFIRSVLHHPDLLILDEPLAHLDEQSRLYIASTLSQYKGAVLLMSHLQEVWKKNGFKHLEFGALNAG